MMKMSFWFGSDLGTFVFSGWDVNSVGAFIGVCLLVVILSILYEALKTSQLYLHRITKASLLPDPPSTTESSTLLSQIVPRLPQFSSTSFYRGFGQWILEVIHYSFHTTLGYFLMLIVMTYNVYIFIAIIVGSAFGHWLFSPALLRLNVKELQKKFSSTNCNSQCGDVIIKSESPSVVSTVAEQLATEINAEVHVVGHEA